MKSSPEIFKRNCPEGFTGQIAAAYAAGADGVYLFNMFYEKSYFSKIRRDPAALAFCNKRYFVTTHMPRRVSAFQPMDGTDGIRSALYPEYPLLLASGGTHDYVIEVGDDFSVIADGSPPPTVRLHLKCSAKQGDELRVALNGTELRAMKSADSVLTFPVDPKSVVRGVNRLTLSAAGDVKPSRELVLSGDALIGPANRLKWRRLFPGNAVKGSESIVEGAYRLSTTDRNPVNLLYPIGNGCGQPLEAEFTLKVEPDSEPGSVVARLANGIGIEVFDFLPSLCGSSMRFRHGKVSSLSGAYRRGCCRIVGRWTSFACRRCRQKCVECRLPSARTAVSYCGNGRVVIPDWCSRSGIGCWSLERRVALQFGVGGQ